MSEQPILEVRGLEKEYPGVRALQGVIRGFLPKNMNIQQLNHRPSTKNH